MTPKEDLFAIMDAVPQGYAAVRQAIVDGKINGMFPHLFGADRCGCIKAHIANSIGLPSYELPGLAKYSMSGDTSPLEKYIYGVRPKQTPCNSVILRDIVICLDEWKAAHDAKAVHEEEIEIELE